METRIFDFSGYNPHQDSFSILDVVGKPQLKPVSIAGIYLHKLPGSMRFTGPVSLITYAATHPELIFVFPIIDGVLSYHLGGTGWVPVPVSTKAEELPGLGIALDSASLVSTINDLSFSTARSIGMAFAFKVVDTADTPGLESITMAGVNSQISGDFHLTHVTGRLPVHSGLDTPSRFFIDLNVHSAAYGANVVSIEDLEVEVNPTTGAWETWLPDTDGMSDRLAAYAFYFNPTFPLVRKVPSVSDIDFGALPLANSY